MGVDPSSAVIGMSADSKLTILSELRAIADKRARIEQLEASNPDKNSRRTTPKTSLVISRKNSPIP
jgi:hypothetical protein